MKVGTSKVKITPPIGSPLAGYSKRVSFSTGVHDDLFARALVLDNGESRAAIVACDLIGILPEITTSVRLKAGSLDIPESNTMVCAYHTHSGPTPDMGYGGMDRYMHNLLGRISSALPVAVSSLGEANFGWASCITSSLTINRRDPMGGPVDPELIALSWKSKGPIAHLVNFTSHAVVLGPDNTLISADYPGYTMRRIEGSTGSVCLFTNGACGDINPLTCSLKARMAKGEDVYDRSGGTFEEAEELGGALAEQALKALEGIEMTEENVLRTARYVFDIPVRPPAPRKLILDRMTELEHQIPELERQNASPDQLYVMGLELRFVKKVINSMERGSTRAEIQGIRVGDVVLLGLPGEVFVEIGLKIKSRGKSHGLKTVVVELANDYLSYLPTKHAFDEGGYEPEIAKRLGYGPELEGLLVDGAEKVFEELS